MEAAPNQVPATECYRHILVPIDDSVPAREGLCEAIRLALCHGGQLRLVHVLNQAPLASPNVTGARFDQLYGQLRQDGLALLSGAEAMVRTAGVAVDARLIEAGGEHAGDCIVEQALEWPADLIVCSTHGRRGLQRLVMGSDAERIVRHSRVPVLLVPMRSATHAVRPAADPAAAPDA